jgi:hypothetical protein
MNPQGALVVGAAWITPLMPKPARRRRRRGPKPAREPSGGEREGVGRGGG